jgi:outer membrane lipoprotein-sorting protein
MSAADLLRTAMAWLLLVSVLVGSPADAQDFDAASSWSQLRAWLAPSIDEQTGQAVAVRGEFQQARYSPLLDEPITSRGIFMRTPRLLRFDTVAPYPSRMLVDDATVTVYFPDAGEAEIYPRDADEDPLSLVLRGDIAALQQSHRLTLTLPEADETSTRTAELEPLDPEAGEHLILRFDVASGALRQMERRDAERGRVVLDLLHVEPDPTLTNEDLALVLPDAVVVTDYAQPQDQP